MNKTRISNVFAVPVIVLLVLIVVTASAPASAQTFSDLYNFGTNSTDPLQPEDPGIIALGRDGNLYSTAPEGGAKGLGAAFKITTQGQLVVLYSFDDTHGATPLSGLTLGTDGNFYGATSAGGASGHGTVFKITPRGKLSLLYSFTGGGDGEVPCAPPIQGKDGDFYGTTYGVFFGNSGTVYKITSSGHLTTLFQLDKNSGGHPCAPLVQGTDGNFYGTTTGLAGAQKGTIFKVTRKGKLTVIHRLMQDTGYHVSGALVQGSDGYFYGVAGDGGVGSGRSGTIFKVAASGKFTVLHNFNGNDGAYPSAGLAPATDGNFYGVTVGGGEFNQGTIYRIAPQGNFSSLYNFDGTAGAGPYVTLLQHTNGALYGDTSEGGILSDCGGVGCGVFYSMDAGLGPFVSMLPISSKVGKAVDILGQGFIGTSAVSFSGTAASFIIKSDTYLTAIVPVGATTGFVTVTTPAGNLRSNKQFTIRP